MSSGVSRPWSCGDAQAGPVAQVDDPLGRLVPEHADGEHLGRQPAGDVLGVVDGDLPAATAQKTKPTASAPIATARSPSSSVGMPQILTNTVGGSVRNPRRTAAD